MLNREALSRNRLALKAAHNIILSAVLLTFVLLPLVAALSPPKTIDLPLQGTPLRIDCDRERYLAISFADRNVLGLYRFDLGSYMEVGTASPVVKTVFIKNKAVSLLSQRDRLMVVDLDTKNTFAVELENAAGAITSDGEKIYISYPAAGKIVGLSSDNLKTVESFEASLADGLDLLSASEGVIWAASPSLDTLVAYGEGGGREVKLEGSIVKIIAAANAVWVVLNDDSVVKIVDGTVAQKTALPRATFVAAVDVLGQTLVYSSISRRVIGVVDPTGQREISMPSYLPISIATDNYRRIWFLDAISRSVGYIYYSQPPKIYNWITNRMLDGSIEVRAEISDPDGDLTSVDLVAVEYQGIYVLRRSYITMQQDQDKYIGIYRPSSDITKVELYVNASDVAGNHAAQKVGEVDYRASPTSPALTTATETVAVQDRQVVLIAAELLLLIPLVLAASLFFLNRKKRRKVGEKERR